MKRVALGRRDLHVAEYLLRLHKAGELKQPQAPVEGQALIFPRPLNGSRNREAVYGTPGVGVPA